MVCGNSVLGKSLVVQWLGLGIFTAMAWVQSLVGELRSHEPHGMEKKKKRNSALSLHIFYKSNIILQKKNLIKTEEIGKRFKQTFQRKYMAGDFPGGTVDKNRPVNSGDTGLIPGPGRFHMPWSN